MKSLGLVRAVLALSCTIMVTGCETLSNGPAVLTTTTAESPLAAQLDTYLSSRNASGAFLFAVDDEVVFKKGYGVLEEGGAPIPSDVVFPIGSITKQFTAVSALHLAARRRLSLSDTIGDFFPEAPADKKPITVHQLLAHTSGLGRNVADVYELVRREEFRSRAFAAKLDFTPGTRHRYSNSGYILLGQIIEKVSGMPLDQYFERYLTRPAGMTSTGYPSPRFEGVPIPRGYDRPKFKEKYSATPMTEPGGQDERYRDGAGGLLSTVSDLFRWEKALAAGRVIPRPWVELMQQPHGIITPDSKFRYGYAWVIQESKSGPMLWHNGVWYSYYSEIRYFPELGVMGIGFTNRQQDETFDETFRRALEQVLNHARQSRQLAN